MQSVSFLGPVFGVEKINVFAEADAFILPSFGEGLPTAVLEAWASKCIVLMSKECNFSLIENETCSIDCGNSKATIVVALKKFFSMTDDVKNTVREAGFVNSREYSWSSAVEIFMKAVRGIT